MDQSSKTIKPKRAIISGLNYTKDDEVRDVDVKSLLIEKYGMDQSSKTIKPKRVIVSDLVKKILTKTYGVDSTKSDKTTYSNFEYSGHGKLEDGGHIEEDGTDFDAAAGNCGALSGSVGAAWGV